MNTKIINDFVNFQNNSIFKDISDIDDEQIYFYNNDNNDDDELPSIISILQILENYYSNNNNNNISILSLLKILFKYDENIKIEDDNNNTIEFYCHRFFLPKHNIKNSISI